ncbi:hypothetical protein GQ457_05G026770 [Hibiscus cannabinus]
MSETQSRGHVFVGKKRGTGADDFDGDTVFVAKKSMLNSMATENDPATALASARHEFGEHGGVNMSIEASATFTVMEPKTMCRMFAGELGPDRDFFIYRRHFNPTVLNIGRLMAALKGTEAAYCTASACNITTTFMDIGDLEAVKNAIVEGKTKVLYFESMSNPTLTVANIPELSRIGFEKGTTMVVDNTFALMVLYPARLDANVVLHSISKFINCGVDVITGSFVIFP